MSAKCKMLQSTDAILLIRMQNCFLSERPLGHQLPQYEISPSLLKGSSLIAGGAAVLDSASVIDVANRWLGLANATNCSIYATLDWHPAQHCSFCELGPWTPMPSGSMCVSGEHTVGQVFDKGRRCTDPISIREFSRNSYRQWPEYCVAGTPGARFDPFLQLPSSTQVIKYGMDISTAAYSAWDGGRLSVAQPGQHDIGSELWENLAPEDDLLVELNNAQYSRLFVMGADEEWVSNTVLDTLGKHNDAPSGYKGLGISRVITSGNRSIQVIMIKAGVGTRAPSLQQELELDLISKGAQVVYGTTPKDAFDELCQGTCDSSAQCDARSEYCVYGPNSHWGECKRCSSASTMGGIVTHGCNGHGTCVEGVCVCDQFYSGSGCSEQMFDTRSLWHDLQLLLGVLVSAGILWEVRRGFVRLQVAFKAEQERTAEKKERIFRAEMSCFECRYNVCYVPYNKFKLLGRLVTHEELQRVGVLQLLNTYAEVVVFVETHPTIFISHQWLSHFEPDPNCVHYPAICEAVEDMCVKFDLDVNDVYLWVDYCSVPQRNMYLQNSSISSLPVYASMTRYFVIIAPPTTHRETGNVCDSVTYQRRGWCRLEQWAHLAGRGIGSMYVYDSTSVSKVDDMHWLRDSINVMEGEFTNPSDREKLVDSCIGLWSIALRDYHVGNANSDIFLLVTEHKHKVFPVEYFGDLVEMLEKDRMTEKVSNTFLKAAAEGVRNRYARRELEMGELSEAERAQCAARRLQLQYRLHLSAKRSRPACTFQLLPPPERSTLVLEEDSSSQPHGQSFFAAISNTFLASRMRACFEAAFKQLLESIGLRRLHQRLPEALV